MRITHNAEDAWACVEGLTENDSPWTSKFIPDIDQGIPSKGLLVHLINAANEKGPSSFGLIVVERNGIWERVGIFEDGLVRFYSISDLPEFPFIPFGIEREELSKSEAFLSLRLRNLEKGTMANMKKELRTIRLG